MRKQKDAVDMVDRLGEYDLIQCCISVDYVVMITKINACEKWSDQFCFNQKAACYVLYDLLCQLGEGGEFFFTDLLHN